MRIISVLAVGAIAVSSALVACGSSDDSKSGASGSYSEVANAVAHPTGTLSTTNATSVADAFEKAAAGSVASGRRLQATQSASQTEQCPNGGNITISVSGNESAATEDLKYNSCCESKDCCINGGGTFYFSSSSGSSDYTMCGSYDLNVACGTDSGSLKYQGCLGTSGEWTYVVTVDGKTYSVSGSYAGGSGTLKITDSKDTWTCTYSDGSGSCTGTSGDFSF